MRRPVLVALGAVSGCGAVTGDDPVRVVDSAGIKITTINSRRVDLPAWSTAAEPDYVIGSGAVADSGALNLLGPVRWLPDGRLVVSDLGSSRLFLFDSTGKHLHTLGRRGSGPCEFREINTVTVVPPDTIVVFDARQRRLSWLPAAPGACRTLVLQGEASLESWPMEAWPWRDRMLVVFQLSISPQDSVVGSGRIRPWPTRAQLTLRDGAGEIVGRGPWFNGMYTGLKSDGDVRLPFSNRPFTAIGPSRVHFGSGRVFSITGLDSSFRVTSEIRWAGFEEPLTPAEVDRVREVIRAGLPAGVPADRVAQLFADVLAPEILPTNRPSIGRVLIDPGGSIWVERFEAPRWRSLAPPFSEEWTVLDPDGRPIAVFRLLPESRLEAVGAKRVAVVTRDSDDVERVEVLRLQRQYPR